LYLQKSTMYDLDLNQRLDVWVGSIRQWQGEKILFDRVTEEERRQAQKYHFEALRTRALVGRGLLRTILAQYVSIDPLEIQIDRGKYGKPYLPHHLDLHFNVSHSADIFLCSVSSAGEVGVDVEAISKMDDSASIAKRHFTAPERTKLEGMTASAHLREFFRFWTRKEAYVKGTGDGLGLDLQSFDVSEDRISFPCSSGGRKEAATDWTIRSFSPSPGYAGAVCLRGEISRLCFMPLDNLLLESD
jgi:4'-phosphopantetheinyl transferase